MSRMDFQHVEPILPELGYWYTLFISCECFLMYIKNSRIAWTVYRFKMLLLDIKLWSGSRDKRPYINSYMLDRNLHCLQFQVQFLSESVFESLTWKLSAIILVWLPRPKINVFGEQSVCLPEGVIFVVVTGTKRGVIRTAEFAVAVALWKIYTDII